MDARKPLPFNAFTPYPTPDTKPGITAPFGHCVAGMHLGAMTPRPVDGEFDAILTLAKDPGHVPDLVRHRHIPISYSKLPLDPFVLAVEWVMHQLDADRKILVRSEGGRQRPGLVIAAVIIRLGGTFYDALMCVHHGNEAALTDFRYLEILRLLDKASHRTGPTT